jgi:hypothetical protein
VKSASGDCEDLPVLRPNDAMLIRTSASQPSGQISLKRFGFAEALKRGSASVYYHRVQPAKLVAMFWRRSVKDTWAMGRCFRKKLYMIMYLEAARSQRFSKSRSSEFCKPAIRLSSGFPYFWK